MSADEGIFQYPGLFAKDSDLDRSLPEIRERTERQRNDLKAIRVRYTGDLADTGLIDADALIPRTLAPPRGWAVGPILHLMDLPFIVELDRRVRWCRRLLDEAECPYDKDDVVVLDQGPGWHRWLYRGDVEAAKSGEAQDALEFVLAATTHHTATWYAAKCLAHIRRASEIIDRSETGLEMSDAFGLMRELVLFGETWSTAKFVVNHGAAAVTGIKQRRVLDETRTKSNGSRRTASAQAANRWQEEADQIWAASPHLSKNAVAAIIHRRGADELTPDWISRRIRKPRRAG